MSATNGSPSADPAQVLKAHQLTEQFQETAEDAVFERSILAIPEKDRATNFTTGTLATTTCFAAAPAIVTSRSKRTALAVYYLGTGFTGHPGYIHGGVISTIFDEVCGRAAVCHYEKMQIERSREAGEAQEKPPTKSGAVTAQLLIDFVAPIQTSSYVIIQAEVQDEGTSSRKARVTAQLWSVALEDGKEDRLCATAKTLFVEPKI